MNTQNVIFFVIGGFFILAVSAIITLVVIGNYAKKDDLKNQSDSILATVSSDTQRLDSKIGRYVRNLTNGDIATVNHAINQQNMIKIAPHVANGDLKNYSQCISNYTGYGINTLLYDDSGTNSTRGNMCSQFYNNPKYIPNDNSDDRKDAYKSNPISGGGAPF
jgi:hypothetical protein